MNLYLDNHERHGLFNGPEVVSIIAFGGKIDEWRCVLVGTGFVNKLVHLSECFLILCGIECCEH